MNQRSAYPGIIASVLLLLFLYLIMGILGLLYASITELLNISILKHHAAIVTAALSSVSFIAVIITGFKFSGRSAAELFPVKKISIPLIFFISIFCFGLVIVLSEADNFVRSSIPVPDFLSKMLADLLLGDNIISTAFLIGIVAPITEELLFRGVILSGLKKKYSIKKSILISALLFSIFHLNPLQMTGAFFGGIFLAWLLIKTENILYSIAAHSIFNIFPLIILRLTPFKIPGFTDMDGSVEFQPLWFDITGILFLITGIILINLHLNKYSLKTEKITSESKNTYLHQTGNEISEN